MQVAKLFHLNFFRSMSRSLSIFLFLLFGTFLAAAQNDVETLPTGPLVVDGNSRLVVMEYENWFGPNAVTFQGTAAKPFLQSADMQAVGGGYDSADPHVIKTHLEWFEYMGVDAALIEVTNNVSCIFNSTWFIDKYKIPCTPPFKLQNVTIRNNTGNVYPSWTALGTRLKLIPLLGGSTEDVLLADIDGKTSLEKEIDYFGALIAGYPDRVVIYEGKPLMLIFLGAAQDPSRADNPEWYQIRKFLATHPQIAEKYTFREMAGYLDSQPYLWAPGVTNNGPEEVDPSYRFWSWVDRENTTCTLPPYCPYFPTYNKAGSRVENYTASISTAGQNGWGCPNENEIPYCPDDALRYTPNQGYASFDSSMSYAAQLKPIFLIIHQFNEFVPPDEGFNANTDDDIEPANLWGNDLGIVKQQIELYRQSISNASDH
jgi:hypothetical protein